MLGTVQRMQNKHGDQGDSDERRYPHMDVGERAAPRNRRNPEQQCCQPGRQQRHAGEVERLRRCRAILVEHHRGEDEQDHPQRQVDPENPLPAVGADQPATEDRPGHRAKEHRDTHHRHQPAEPPRTGLAHQDDQRQRHQHPATESLYHSKRDELVDV